MRNKYRYQLAGCSKKATNFYELGDLILRYIGTVPEFSVIDTVEDRVLSWDEIEIITGIKQTYFKRILNLNMCINSLFGQAQEYRRKNYKPSSSATETAEIHDEIVEKAAQVAENACLVDPDGGSPSREEYQVCQEAARRIRNLKKTLKKLEPFSEFVWVDIEILCQTPKNLLIDTGIGRPKWIPKNVAYNLSPAFSVNNKYRLYIDKNVLKEWGVEWQNG